MGPTRAAWGLPSSPPDPLLCAALAPFGGLFARSGSPLAPGPLPLGGSPPGRAARPCCGPPAPAPRLPRSALFAGAPSPAPCGARCRPCAWAPLRCAAGSLLGRPCCALARRCASGRPAPSSRRPPSGFGACPPRCARRRRLLAPGRWAACAALWAALRPGALWVLGGPARLRCPAVRALCGPTGLSPAPPRPAAPAGGSGVRVACCARGLRPPPRGRFLAALWAAPPGPGSAPGAPFSARLTVRKLSTGHLHASCRRPFSTAFSTAPPPLSHCPAAVKAALRLALGGSEVPPRASALTLPGLFCPAGLTFPARWAILFVRGLLSAPSGARPRRSVDARGNPHSVLSGWGFFSAPGPLRPCRK